MCKVILYNYNMSILRVLMVLFVTIYHISADTAFHKEYFGFDLNDILKENLMPAREFVNKIEDTMASLSLLRKYFSLTTEKSSRRSDSKAAFFTMVFYRSVMQEYFVKQFVARQIFNDFPKSNVLDWSDTRIEKRIGHSEANLYLNSYYNKRKCDDVKFCKRENLQKCLRSKQMKKNQRELNDTQHSPVDDRVFPKSLMRHQSRPAIVSDDTNSTNYDFYDGAVTGYAYIGSKSDMVCLFYLVLIK